MQNINLSINPSYLCNFRCSFCYLTPKDLADKKKLNLNDLQDRLTELAKFRTIHHVDLYGGELALLPKDYLRTMKLMIQGFTSEPINIVTNLSQIHPLFLEDNITLAVSWDYNCRQSYHIVLDNILKIEKNVHILMLASPKMLQWTEETINEVIQIFNLTPNIVSVEIKPYSSNQANQFKKTNRKFEDFIIKWLSKQRTFQFQFINEDLVQDAIQLKNNSWSDDHLYITPNGKFAVLDFDSQDNEYFQEIQDYSQYKQWCLKEKSQISKNSICSSCQYYGHCLSEHLRNVGDTQDSCSGFKGLLTWYEKKLIHTR